MSDVVDFAAPLGFLGSVAEILALGRYMPTLIRIRNEHVKRVSEIASVDG
jgi:hypothetical protein